MAALYVSVLIGIVIGSIAAFVAAKSGRRWLPVFLITTIIASVVTFLIWGRNLSVNNVSNQ
jgi:hypothetical protein